MVIVESGEAAVKMAIINTEYVEMVNIPSNILCTGHIKWAEEQMDIVIMEDTKQEDMVIEHSGGEPVEMDLMYGSGVMMVSEECKEETMNLVGGHLPDGKCGGSGELYCIYTPLP